MAVATANLVALAQELADTLGLVVFERLGSATVAGAGGSIVRSYVPRAGLETLKDLLVTILPNKEDIKRDSRNSWLHEPAIEIGIQKRIEDEVADVDLLMGFAQDVCDWLKTFASSLSPRTKIKEVKLHTSYSDEHLDQEKVYTAVLIATFQQERQ